MRLASTLCYVQAVFLFLSAIALGIPAFAGGGAPLTAFAFVTGIAAVGTGFFFAARLVRKGRLRGAQVALALVAADLVLRLLMGLSLLNVWLAVDLGIVLLVATDWRSFDRAKPGAGAP